MFLHIVKIKIHLWEKVYIFSHKRQFIMSNYGKSVNLFEGFSHSLRSIYKVFHKSLFIYKKPTLLKTSAYLYIKLFYSCTELFSMVTSRTSPYIP